MAADTQSTEQAPTENGQMLLPLDERRDIAVAASYAEHGYLTPAGEKDTGAVRAAVFAIVAEAVVEAKGDRAQKAITRATLVTDVFPQLPDREAWGDEEDPALAEAVYKAIDQVVWGNAKPDHSGAVQKQVGNLGYVLCRTKVGKDGVDAVYITKDIGCLLEDFSGPLKSAAKKAADNLGRNLGMVTDRLPEHARAIDRDYKRGMKDALNAGASALAPALTAATSGEEEDE